MIRAREIAFSRETGSHDFRRSKKSCEPVSRELPISRARTHESGFHGNTRNNHFRASLSRANFIFRARENAFSRETGSHEKVGVRQPFPESGVVGAHMQ